MALSALVLLFVPTATSIPPDGTGLGMPDSYGLIRRYAGNITAESTLREGSIFSVWLLQEPMLLEDEVTAVSGQPHCTDY
ncbi:MAG: hypothetical protein ABW168_25570 [Sedimenticola sp.]